jgi:nitroreductase
MDFTELLRTRSSVRAFRDQPVSIDDAGTILEAAQSAPSAGNEQAYEIAVVTHRDRLRRLAHAAQDQEFVAHAPLVLVFSAVPSRASVAYGERGAGLFCVQDATIACAYAQLAAAELGLSAVWVGSFDPLLVEREIDATEGVIPVAMLAIGEPAAFGELSQRRPLGDLVRRVDAEW